MASSQIEKIYWIFLSTMLAMICLSCHQEPSTKKIIIKKETPSIQLEKISVEESGLNFSNQIKENSRLHAFIWNFIYQGAGVSIGDINNDGLPDIYFSGNMVSDKLFLNMGNFKFEDISASAGIQDKLWSTGVTMVDINNDGLLDIYVCKNFFLLQKGVRTNKLFINNGDLTFTESAKEYGLDDAGYSVQSNFFDADNDGDLDMYLINQPMDQYATQLAKPETLKKLPFSDKLYINEKGFYSDKSKSAKLNSRSYGLSAITADLNNDGLIDIYLCNDYDSGDKFFINKGNLNFNNEISERIDHSSYYSMGSDASDINNDGLLDFMTLDMAFKSHYRSKTNMKSMQPEKFWSLVDDGNYYQYPVNNLHVNDGNGYYSELAQFLNLSKTDWSWSCLFVDLDSDMNNDLLVSNGLLRDLRNSDFITNSTDQTAFTVNSQNYQTVLNSIPSTPVSNFLYKNNSNLDFSDITKSSGFYDKGFASGMAYGDLDGDGDMDVVINNTNNLASVFKNNSPPQNYVNIVLKGSQNNKNAIGATVTLFAGEHKQIMTQNNCRGYMSSSEMKMHFGLAQHQKIDSIVIRWNRNEYSTLSDVPINEDYFVEYTKVRILKKEPKEPVNMIANQLNLNYVHRENEFDDYAKQILLPHKLSQNGPLISIGDLDGDEKEDLFIGGAHGQAGTIYLQQTDRQFKSIKSKALTIDKKHEDLESILFDVDNDNDLDIYVVSGGSQFSDNSQLNIDRLYINDGKANFKRSHQSLNFSNFDGECVKGADFNNDGFIDLFIGGRSIPGAYGQKPPSKIIINNNGILEDHTQQWLGNFNNLGMVTDAIIVDSDNDSDLDIIIVGEWMSPQLLINEDGRFKIQDLTKDINLTGWHWCIKQGDFDNDGDPDFLVGNLGLNNKFKASPENKFQLFSGDLDDNGDHDVVLAKATNTSVLPVRGKECSTQEMPFISQKFKTYDAYAKANLIDIYDDHKLKTSLSATIESFEHIYIENKGQNNFLVRPLPYLCQTGPIKDFIIIDINHDGILDFIYGGNHYPSEVETVRYDSNKGGVCIGKGDGNFIHYNGRDLGIYLRGDVRDIECIKLGGELYLLATINNGNILTQKLKISSLQK